MSSSGSSQPELSGPEAGGSELTELELACGLPLGIDADAPALEPAVASADPLGAARRALERAIVPALERPPCLVSFSGGRDSSALLALACRLAEREGLAAPVAFTLRFEDAASREDEWQSELVAALGVADWIVEEPGDELGFLGPLAREALASAGVLWPPNCHFNTPALRRAGAGSVVSGFDGDSVFSTWRWRRLARLRAHPASLRPGDLRLLAAAAAPSGLRRERIRRRSVAEAPDWLSADARRRFAELESERLAAEPRRWTAWPGWLVRQRYERIAEDSLRRLATDFESELHMPLIDRGFLAALARMPPGAVHSRTAAMDALVGDLLPPRHVARSTKAEFDAVFWTAETRRLAAETNDEIGLPGAEPGVLRAEWASAEPDGRSSVALQHAWLASRRAEVIVAP